MEATELEQLKTSIFMELHGYISFKAQQTELEKKDALEIGAFVGADFITRINDSKTDGPISKDELSSVMNLLLEFFKDSFKNQFEQRDADAMIGLLGRIIQNTEERREIIDNYLKKLLPK